MKSNMQHFCDNVHLNVTSQISSKIPKMMLNRNQYKPRDVTAILFSYQLPLIPEICLCCVYH